MEGPKSQSLRALKTSWFEIDPQRRDFGVFTVKAWDAV